MSESSDESGESDLLEERRVEIVARDDDLDQDEQGSQRNRDEAVDKGSVESWERKRVSS